MNVHWFVMSYFLHFLFLWLGLRLFGFDYVSLCSGFTERLSWQTELVDSSAALALRLQEKQNIAFSLIGKESVLWVAVMTKI